MTWPPHQMSWHDMTCHVATNHSSPPHVTSQTTTLLHLTPQATSWHQNRSHHHHGTAEGSFAAKEWFGHRAGRSPCAHSIGKFCLCYIVLFSSETSAPGSNISKLPEGKSQVTSFQLWNDRSTLCNKSRLGEPPETSRPMPGFLARWNWALRVRLATRLNHWRTLTLTIWWQMAAGICAFKTNQNEQKKTVHKMWFLKSASKWTYSKPWHLA